MATIASLLSPLEERRLAARVAQILRQDELNPKQKTLRQRLEERDECLYRNVMSGFTYRQILDELEPYFAEYDWPSVTTPQGLYNAARRYAQRHGLRRPPKRKPGRPRRS